MQRCSVPVTQGAGIPKFYFNSYTRQTRRTAAPVDEIHVTLPEIDLEYQSSGQSASGENHKESQSAVQTEEENTGDLQAEKVVEELQGNAKKVNNTQTSCTLQARRESLPHSGKRRVSNWSKLKKTDIGLADVLSAIDRGARDPQRESQENEHNDWNYQENINDIVDSLTKGIDSWDVVDKRTNSRSRKKTRGHIKLKTHRPKGGGRRRNMASRRHNLGFETVVARSPSVCRSYSKEDILVPIEMSSRFVSTLAQDADRVFGNNGWLMRRSKSLDRIGPMPVASSVSSWQKSGQGERNGFLPLMSQRPSVVSQRPLGSTRSYSICAKRGTRTRQNADSVYADQLSKSRQLSHSKFTKTPVMVTLDANVLKENDIKRSSVESGVYRRLKSADLSRDGHVDARNLTAMKCTLLQRELTNGTITKGANVKQCDRVATKEGKENNMQVRDHEGASPTNSNTTSYSDNQSITQPDNMWTSDKKKDTKQKMTNGRTGMNGSRELPKSILKIKQETVPCVESSDSSSRTTTESSSGASSATRNTQKKRLVAERIARANLGLSEFTGVEIGPEMGSGVVASHYPGDTDVEFVLERSKPTRVRFNSDDEVMEYVPW